MKNITKSNGLDSGVNVVMALVMIVVVGAIGIFVADTVVTETSVTPANITATGTLTFTDNFTDAETVTIQGVVFEFNASGAAATAGRVEVNTSGNLSADIATANLNTAINANATVNASVTATNPTNVTVLLTAVAEGAAGNAVTTTETVTNASWIGATLAGGLTKSKVGGMQTNILSAGETGSAFIVILVIAFIGGLAISFMFGLTEKRD